MPVELFRHIARTHEPEGYTLYAPSPDLQQVVSSYFLYNTTTQNQLREFAFADGQPGIVFLLDPPHTYCFSVQNRMETRQYAFMSGVLLEGVYIERKQSAQRLFGIRFTAQGLYHLVREPVSNLRGAVSWEPGHIFGKQADSLVEAVLLQQTTEQRIAIVETFLREHLRGAVHTDYVYEEAVRSIKNSGGQMRIDALLDSLGVNYKWLERKCALYTGMTPKEYARIHRFLRAFFALRQHGQPDSISVAFDNGYYDQAHFIREFRRFTAQTPRAFFSR
jgi:AraC-like DNA-binding protein